MKKTFLSLLLLTVLPINTCASEQKLKFLVLTPFSEYSFFSPVEKGMQDAAKAMGVEAVFSGTVDGNVENLAEMVSQGVKDGYDGIALNTFHPTAFDKVIADAMKAGVPIIAFNVDDNKTPNARLAAIGQNMWAAGNIFGKKALEFVPDNSHVLMTMHDPGIDALEDRLHGAQEQLKKHGIRWTEIITGSADRELAIKRVKEALDANPKIKIILGTGTADTEAAGLAIEKYFPDQGYVSAGFDLNPDILRLIKQGIIQFTIDQQPYAQGYYSIVGLTLYKRYGIKPSSIDTGATIINKNTVDEVLELSKQHYR